MHTRSQQTIRHTTLAAMLWLGMASGSAVAAGGAAAPEVDVFSTNGEWHELSPDRFSTNGERYEEVQPQLAGKAEPDIPYQVIDTTTDLNTALPPTAAGVAEASEEIVDMTY